VKTWAPRGERPILREGNPYTHLSVISAITPEDDLYFQIRDSAFDSEGVIAFLNELHQQIPGKLLVIWDGATIHRSKEIIQYLSDGATEWLLLERLPGYAPDLNPDEGIWNHLKYVELKNQCFQTVRHLEAAARDALTTMQQHAAEIITACLAQARLC
jgi:transposase